MAEKVGNIETERQEQEPIVDFYELLGVDRKLNWEEFKKQVEKNYNEKYDEISKNKNISDEKKLELINELINAKATLSKKRKKDKYDEQLKKTQTPDEETSEGQELKIPEANKTIEATPAAEKTVEITPAAEPEIKPVEAPVPAGAPGAKPAEAEAPVVEVGKDAKPEEGPVAPAPAAEKGPPSEGEVVKTALSQEENKEKLNEFWEKYDEKGKLNKKSLIKELIGIDINNKEESFNIEVELGPNAIGIYVSPRNRRLFEKLAARDATTPETNVNDRVLSTTKRNKKGLHCIIVDSGHKGFREEGRYSFEKVMEHEKEHVDFYLRNKESEKKILERYSKESLQYALHLAQGEILASLKNHDGTLTFAYKFNPDKKNKSFGTYDYAENIKGEEDKEKYYETINNALIAFNNLIDLKKCKKEEAVKFLVEKYVPLSEWPKKVEELLGDKGGEENIDNHKKEKGKILNEIRERAKENKRLWDEINKLEKSEKYEKLQKWYNDYIESLESDESRFMQGSIGQLEKEKEILERVHKRYVIKVEKQKAESGSGRESAEKGGKTEPEALKRDDGEGTTSVVTEEDKQKKTAEENKESQTIIYHRPHEKSVEATSRKRPLEEGVTAGQVAGVVFGEEFKDEVSRLWTKKFWLKDAPGGIKDWWNEKATWKFWQWFYSDRTKNIESEEGAEEEGQGDPRKNIAQESTKLAASPTGAVKSPTRTADVPITPAAEQEKPEESQTKKPTEEVLIEGEAKSMPINPGEKERIEKDFEEKFEALYKKIKEDNSILSDNKKNLINFIKNEKNSIENEERKINNKFFDTLLEEGLYESGISDKLKKEIKELCRNYNNYITEKKEEFKK